LGGHDLSVGTRDGDAGVQASLVVSLDDVTAEDLAGTNTAVVWALWSGETVDWPSVWSVGHIKKGVFLLKTEPWLVFLVGLHELSSLVAVVELVWGSVGVPALAENEDVWGAADWVMEDGNGSEVDIRVVARCLPSRRTVKVPFWERLEGDATRSDLDNSLREKGELAIMFLPRVAHAPLQPGTLHELLIIGPFWSRIPCPARRKMTEAGVGGDLRYCGIILILILGGASASSYRACKKAWRGGGVGVGNAVAVARVVE
jgi:hypothetical protein